MRTHLARVLLAAAVITTTQCSDVQAGQLSAVKGPRKIKDVKPAYPKESLSAGDEGVVLVELKVDASGLVTDARVLRSKCPALNESALEAARKWQFERLPLNGHATPFTITTDVRFRLPEELKSRRGRPGACRWEDPAKPIF